MDKEEVYQDIKQMLDIRRETNIMFEDFTYNLELVYEYVITFNDNNKVNGLTYFEWFAYKDEMSDIIDRLIENGY